MGLLGEVPKTAKTAAAALFAAPAAAVQAAKSTRKRARQPDEASASADDQPGQPTEAPAQQTVKQKAPTGAQERAAVKGEPSAHDRVRDVGDKKKRTRVNKPAKSEDKEAEAEKLTRTVFVGNIPAKTDRRQIQSKFASFGPVDSVRIRSVAAANPKMPQKGAVITGQIDTAVRDSVNAYVVFKQVPSAERALAANGELMFDRHVRIDAARPPAVAVYAAAASGDAAAPTKYDTKRCVFVGNLPYDAQEEAVWAHFEQCGKVQYVRLVREPRSQLGKGFGYVAFEQEGSVESAIALHEQPFGDRSLRVFRCSASKGLKGVAAAQAAPTAGGAGAGWQNREKRRELVSKHKLKTVRKSGGPPTAQKSLKIGSSAIVKQRKLLKERKKTKQERKARKVAGKASAKRDPKKSPVERKAGKKK